jgi:hypothetical protein
MLKRGGFLMKDRSKLYLVAILLIAILFLSGCDNSVNYNPPASSIGMAITHYSFGKMTIDGKNYDVDLMILPNGKIKNWAIDLGSHMLNADDLTPLITEETKTVIIGTGNSGQVKLSDDAQKLFDRLKIKGVRIFVEKTGTAVKEFNKIPKQGLLACFHLNC